MKILGDTRFQRTGKWRFTIGDRYYDITLCSLPYGFDEDLEKILPSPVPPRKPVYGPKGEKVFVKGSKTVQLTEPNEDDPKYLRKLAENRVHQGLWMIYNGLKCEPNWVWDHKPEDYPDNLSGFCEAIREELRKSEMPYGVMGDMLRAILEISGTPDEAIEEAEQDFLSGTSSD